METVSAILEVHKSENKYHSQYIFFDLPKPKNLKSLTPMERIEKAEALTVKDFIEKAREDYLQDDPNKDKYTGTMIIEDLYDGHKEVIPLDEKASVLLSRYHKVFSFSIKKQGDLS